MQEIRIPALTTLTSEDSVAVRSIVSTLLREINELRRDVDSLKKTRESVYSNRMGGGRL
jgi:hypothetical protein